MNKSNTTFFLFCFIFCAQSYAMDITILENKDGKCISFVRQEQISITLTEKDVKNIEDQGLAIYLQGNIKKDIFEHENLIYVSFAKNNPATESAYLLYLLVDSKHTNNLVHLHKNWSHYKNIVEQLKKYGFVQKQPPKQKTIEKKDTPILQSNHSIFKYVTLFATIVTCVSAFSWQYKKSKARFK